MCMDNKQETCVRIKQRKMLRIDKIGYLERTFMKQKLSFDFQDTSSMVIRHAGHLKMIVKTSFDYLIGSALVFPFGWRDGKVR